MSRLSAWREPVAFASVLVAVLVVFAGGSAFWLYNMTLVALFAIVAIGLNVVLGNAGQVTFAQTTFMAIGAYGAAKLTTSHGVDPWLALGLSALVAAAVSILIGLPLLRLRGHYLGMATFALALGTVSFATGAAKLTGGSAGIFAIPPLRIGSHNLADPRSFYILSWLVCGLSLLVYALLTRSHIGRAWRAIGTRQDVAASLGVDVRRYKLLALLVAAVMASVAGSLYGEFTTFVGPDFFGIATIINIFLMVFIGGRGSLMGPVVGALFVVLVPQVGSGLGSWQQTFFFVVLLACLIVLPAGLLGRSYDTASIRVLVPRRLGRRRPVRRPA